MTPARHFRTLEPIRAADEWTLVPQHFRALPRWPYTEREAA